MNIMEALRSEDYPLRRKVLAILLVALCLGAGFLALVLLLGSCSGRLDGALRQDGSLLMNFELETPAPIAAKLREFGRAGGAEARASVPLFSMDEFRASVKSRPGLDLLELTQPSPDSLKGTVSVRNLSQFAAGAELKDAGLLAVSSGPDWSELRIRVARGQAKALSALLPGLDPDLLDALSPPALDEEGGDISAAEYRRMLESVLGKKAMPALEKTAIAISLAAPGRVIASGGGRLEGATLSVRIPVIDALVLERPIEFWIRWETR